MSVERRTVLILENPRFTSSATDWLTVDVVARREEDGRSDGHGGPHYSYLVLGTTDFRMDRNLRATLEFFERGKR